MLSMDGCTCTTPSSWSTTVAVRSQGGFQSRLSVIPDSALGPIGKVLIYQALMLENLDFSFEKQYEPPPSRPATARSGAGGERNVAWKTSS